MARSFPKLDGTLGLADFWEHLRNLIAVDRQLRRGRFPGGGELAAKLGVRLPTVHRYIDFLRDLGAPLEYREAEKGRITPPLLEHAVFQRVVGSVGERTVPVRGAPS